MLTALSFVRVHTPSAPPFVGAILSFRVHTPPMLLVRLDMYAPIPLHLVALAHVCPFQMSRTAFGDMPYSDPTSWLDLRPIAAYISLAWTSVRIARGHPRRELFGLTVGAPRITTLPFACAHVTPSHISCTALDDMPYSDPTSCFTECDRMIVSTPLHHMLLLRGWFVISGKQLTSLGLLFMMA